MPKHDIFDDVYAMVGCDYISDLRYNQFTIIHILEHIDLSLYSYDNLEDFSDYVFGLKYAELKAILENPVCLVS